MLVLLFLYSFKKGIMASKKLGREQENRVQKAVVVDVGGILLRTDVDRFSMPRSSLSHLLSEKNIFG